MLAVGLKQNMVTGLAFGGVVLLVSAVRKEITWGAFTKLAAAALLGAAIPLAATIGWCLANGVHLETLWYTVYGFRSHALDVIANDEAGAPLGRARLLTLIFFATGMAFLVLWFLANLRHAWRTHPGGHPGRARRARGRRRGRGARRQLLAPLPARAGALGGAVHSPGR